MDLLTTYASSSDEELGEPAAAAARPTTTPSAANALSLVLHSNAAAAATKSASSTNSQYALVTTNINQLPPPPPPPRVAAHQQSHAHTMHVSSMHSFRHAMHHTNHASSNARPEVRIGPPEDDQYVGMSKRKRKRRRKNKEQQQNVGDDLTHGPWAPMAEQVKVPKPAAISSSTDSSSSSSSSSSSTDHSKEMADDSNAISERTAADRKAAKRAALTSSVFHGARARDYQGRSWIERPRGVNPDEEHDCFMPKRVLRTLSGHEAGVWDVALAPQYGHLLLSASTDKTVKVWNFCDDPEDYTNMRTYYGHEQAVRSVAFSEDERSFVSGSFDRSMKVWDLETGQCTGSFTNGSIVNQVLFSKREPNVVMSACKNRCVMQYDLRSGEMVQEYNYHLDSVNSITFYGDGNRFMSTSDDKKILLWDYNTPTPHKYIAEPHMHSMPSATLSPDGTNIAGQCMDNTIRVYSTQGRFTLSKNREFKGHVVTGYSCQVAFSPNGRFLASGDESGQLWFWDWQRSKRLKTLKGHSNGPLISLKWHPLRPSCMVSCGWDGKIKIWD
jgi:pre-mRNA-processing factor 17